MKKRTNKKSKLEELDAKQQELERKLVQAYTTGMSENIINQLRDLIELNRLAIYEENQLQIHRSQSRGDGEDYIV